MHTVHLNTVFTGMKCFNLSQCDRRHVGALWWNHKWWEMNMIPIGWIKESWRSLWVREWCRQCGCGSWHGPNMNCMTEDACQGQSDINFFDRTWFTGRSEHASPFQLLISSRSLAQGWEKDFGCYACLLLEKTRNHFWHCNHFHH